MKILLLLLPITLGFIGIIVWAFVWAVKTGQFDDLEGPAHRILMDDDDPRIPHRCPAGKPDKSLVKEDK
ncbi:MAG: cbb3-type cytochrome oxidase assembly protein CcoS [Candidatus Competibacteraceae bacterium]|jgi:cbb3-type cytochrome oxidase maturation protein|nr:cbb3-type cytochrome oxidase assembly protein CcoS [Candidatus Competibacteraceae bacterium]